MITGSLVALVTPMHPNGDIHWEDLDKLVDFHIENGTHGIVAVGTTGESATLDPEEHCQTIGHIIKRVNGRIPVIAGTGGNSTREAIELTAEAHKLGADACLLVVPYYNKPPQEGLYRHFKAIAEKVDLPCIVYNVTSRTSLNMTDETTIRLSEIDNIVGVKEAGSDLDQITRIIDGAKPGFLVWSGNDNETFYIMGAGGYGIVSVASHLVGNQIKAMMGMILEGDIERAAAEQMQ